MDTGELVTKKKMQPLMLSSKTSIIDNVYWYEFHLAISGTFFDLPQELLVEVLSRLPLKSFACLKCVSKQWNRFISNAVTIRNSPKLLYRSSSIENRLSLHSLDEELRIENICNPIEEPLFPSARVQSSCNGFLLIENNRDLVVWNPLTKFFKKVLTRNAYSRYYDRYSLADLCYDYANDEYKIMLVMQYLTPDWKKDDFYVAKCGACKFEKLNVPSIVKVVTQGPSFRGYKHWISNNNRWSFDQLDLSLNRIFYFDPSVNKFIEVPMPKPKKGETDYIVELGVLSDCLCITRWNNPLNYESKIEFLSMKEYGNGDSWNTLFVISELPKDFRVYDTMVPLFKTNKEEVVMCARVGSSWTVKAYDTDGKFLRDIVSPYHYFSDKLVLFEESWFSPPLV